MDELLQFLNLSVRQAVHVFRAGPVIETIPNRCFGPALWGFRRRRFFFGFPHLDFHDCRHTYAFLLLRKGESPVHVQHQLGHHDISMTVGTYGHLIPGENRQAVNRLDDPDWRTEKAARASTGNRMTTSNEKGVRLVGLTP